MSVDFISCIAAEVDEAIGIEDAHDQVVAVHGLLYQGDEYADEIVLLPAKHATDTTDSGPPPKPERKDVIRLNDPRLSEHAIGLLPVFTGACRFKYDCVVIGRLKLEPRGDFGAELVDLRLLALQAWPKAADRRSNHWILLQEGRPLFEEFESQVRWHSGPVVRVRPIQD